LRLGERHRGGTRQEGAGAGAMASFGQTAVTVYPIANYNFGVKAPRVEKDKSVGDRLLRMRAKYLKEGQRRSVEGILLVQDHGHPHILLLQIGNTFYKLPGGRLRPGETEIEGLKRKLVSNLSPEEASLATNWEIGDCAGIYWRPNFENNILYPYLPPHITKPKECKKIFIVPLPEKCYFSVPRNLKLMAVPLFELYENMPRYGPVISALPQMLSRFHFTMSRGIKVLEEPPAGAQEGQAVVKEEAPPEERHVKREEQEDVY